jgi:hypothetical protein
MAHRGIEFGLTYNNVFVAGEPLLRHNSFLDWMAGSHHRAVRRLTQGRFVTERKSTMAKKKTRVQTAARYRFQYAAKFLCTANIPGTSQTTSALLPGSYQTAVNIHNPQRRTVELRTKLAVASGEISKFINGKLESDAATRVDCGNVDNYGLRLIHGFEGFLVVESTHSLDVVAVYTAGARGAEVSSIDVEQVPERRI